ncbi:TA system toxin CbtA family protein [Escherichia coli]|uniref:TA system toxin CbtA family protein n=1 Tax=Escherichia coli TaxID=562 RepID=UPI0038FC04E8
MKIRSPSPVTIWQTLLTRLLDQHSLISSSISNKHSSQNSLSSESLCSRTLLFLLQRAHPFIFPRLCDLVIWGTWKMGVASLS